MGPERTFAIRYHPVWGGLLKVMGLGPRWAGAEVTDREVRIRMGWAFGLTAPRTAVTRLHQDRPPWWWGIGVHTDFRGAWVVNGSLEGIVWLEFDPRPPGHTMGIPIHPRRVGVSLEDPEAFLSALRGDHPTP